MSIIIINKSSSNRTKPDTSNVITQKGKRESYTHNSGLQKSSGIRESCEDIICSECNTYVSQKNYDGYKTCKQNCFKEKRDEITACCQSYCQDLGQGTVSCIEACSNELQFF